MDIVDRYIVQARGEQEISALRAALEKQVQALIAAEKALDGTAAASANLAKAQAATRMAAGDLQRVEEAFGKAGGKMAGFGQAAMQTGRVVQDFTAGLSAGGLGGAFNAISNNLEGLTMALGGPAGLAGVVTIVGVAITMLAPKIKEFVNSLTGAKVDVFTADLEALKKTIEDLEARDHKVALDFQDLDIARRRLEEMQDALAKFNAVRNPSAVEDFGGMVSKAIKETMGGDELARAVAKQLSDARFLTPEEDEKAAGIRANLAAGQKVEREAAAGDAMAIRSLPAVRRMTAQFQAQLDELLAPIQERKLEEARKVVGAAAGGDIGAVGKLRNFAERNPGSFTPEFRQEMKGMPSTPEELKKLKDQEEMQKLDEEDRNEEKARLKKLKDREREDTDAEAQRLEDEDAANLAAFQKAQARNKARAARLDRRTEETLDAADKLGEKDVAEAAHRFGNDPISTRVQQDLLAARARGEGGMTAGMIARRQVQDYLARQGVGELDRPAVAARIVAEAQTKLGERVAGNQALGLDAMHAALATMQQLNEDLTKQQQEILRLKAGFAGVGHTRRKLPVARPGILDQGGGF